MEILARDIVTRVEGGAVRPLFTGRLFGRTLVITAPPLTRPLVRLSLEDAENDKGQAKQAGKRHQYRNEPKVHLKFAQSSGQGGKSK